MREGYGAAPPLAIAPRGMPLVNREVPDQDIR
jgi:hypothetical protein